MHSNSPKKNFPNLSAAESNPMNSAEPTDVVFDRKPQSIRSFALQSLKAAKLALLHPFTPSNKESIEAYRRDAAYRNSLLKPTKTPAETSTPVPDDIQAAKDAIGHSFSIAAAMGNPTDAKLDTVEDMQNRTRQKIAQETSHLPPRDLHGPDGSINIT